MPLISCLFRQRIRLPTSSQNPLPGRPLNKAGVCLVCMPSLTCTEGGVLLGWWLVHVGDITTAGDDEWIRAPEMPSKEANQSPANLGGRRVDPLDLSQGDKWSTIEYIAGYGHLHDSSFLTDVDVESAGRQDFYAKHSDIVLRKGLP